MNVAVKRSGAVSISKVPALATGAIGPVPGTKSRFTLDDPIVTLENVTGNEKPVPLAVTVYVPAFRRRL